MTMSNILCQWLNQELRLSKTVDTETFAKDFSSGYLIGEILHKYQLQDDFTLFMKKDTSISKVNNFRRLEPTLKLLGISFDINTAQDLMQEKQGVATHLLHQLYVSLEKKKNAEISRTMMEIMQPVARANLHKKEHEICSYRLPQVLKSDSKLKLQQISQHYKDNCQTLNQRSVMPQPIQQKIQLKVQDEKRTRNSEKLRRRKHWSMTCNQDTKVQVPKPISCFSSLNIERRQQQRKERGVRMVETEITNFETNQKKLFTSGFASFSSSRDRPLHRDVSPGGSKQGCKVSGGGTELILQSSNKYIQEIRQRQKENAISCEQRQKRQDSFVVEQLRALQAQQDALQEELLVKRLTRQTKVEQRLAAQLLQIRKEKEVIQENRLFREQQYQQRRETDFQEALYKESVLAQQTKLAHAEEIRKEIEFCERIAAERAQIKRKKHFEMCKEVLEQIVELTTKVGEHRLVTGKLIPEKMMSDWKELLFKGLPLYEPTKSHRTEFEFSTPQDPTELKKQEILNSLDYDEYTNMVGEWAWPDEDGEIRLPPHNNILGHAVQRLRKIVLSSIVELSSPVFPCFTIKACVLGQFCSGKTKSLAKIAEALGIYVLSADALIEEALEAYKNGEKVIEQQEEKSNAELLTNSPIKIDFNFQEENGVYDKTLTTRARQGEAADREMRKGNTVPNELVVEILVEAISQVPAQSGWILDGFPYDITQAQLLEKALGGSVDNGNEVKLDRTNLAADPDPCEPSPSPAPVLDLAVLLDIPDECAVRRAYSHIDTDAAEGTQPDKTLYLTQISHRITTFHHTWPALEKWFDEKQNILVRVDANVDHEELYSSLKSIFQQAMCKKQEALTHHPSKDVVLPTIKASDASSTTTQPHPVDQPPVLTGEELGPTEPYSTVKQEEVQTESILCRSNTQSPGGSRPSGHTSTSSVSKEDFQGTNNNQPQFVTSCQDYVDKPLPPEIPQYLCSHWDTVCDSYVNNVKKVMQELRSQRSTFDHQLFDISEGYKHYLGRPNIKQELLSQWQKDFNSIPDDMRDIEDTRAELHMRLDELREQLWDITDKCKEENEQERATLMCNGWLGGNTVILINHHSILMQVELSRFQETLDILRVYYLSMHRQMPLEPLSKYFSISLLETPEIKAQDERCPDSSEIRKDEDQEQPAKPPHEKLITDYEEALKAISELVMWVSAEAHHRETKEKKESLQEENTTSAKANKAKKEKQSSEKKGDDLDKIQTEEVRDSLLQEYAAALNHEENAGKVRIELVKSHGLKMTNSLQRKAQESFSKMEKWLQAHYLAELKCIDQLSEVARHHIEAGAKLQYELVLEGSDFFINGDHLLEASLAPPPHPPPVEKPIGSTPTIAQLESLHHQLWSIAPSGLMSSSVFLNSISDLVFINMDRNTLPRPWMVNGIQLAEIVSLLTDDYELIDWHRFLLSAALPWPFPSQTQLLDVLEGFKVADVGDTGYINKEQYLKTELWFSSESVTVAEDPSEPVPYNRLANLRKFFFQLFADHSLSPPQLDYMSMLKYFAADPNPRHGFIRALSVVLGQNLKQPSVDHLVESLPRIEEATEPTSLVLDRDYKEEESNCFREEEVSIPALLNVICHKIAKMKDSNPLPPGCLSQEKHTEHLEHVYRELGYEPEDCIPFSILSKHPYTQMLMETSTQYQLVNIHQVLQGNWDEEEPNI